MLDARLCGRRFLLATAAMVGIAISATALAKTEKNPADKDDTALIVQAREAFQKGRLPELDRLMAQTQGSLLGVWPDYWRLKLLLGIQGIDAQVMKSNVQAFLSRHPKHPLRENAQRDWINALVAKNLWADAEAAISSLTEHVSGPQIPCAKARLGMVAKDPATGDAQSAPLAVGQESFDACLALVEQLAANEQVTVGYLRQRARWAAQVGSDASHNKMIDILRRHAAAHELGARGPDPFKTEEILGKILKVSRTDSLASLQSFKKYRKELTVEQDRYAAFAVGAALWRRTHSDAWPLMLEGWSTMGQQPEEIIQIAARESIRRGAWEKLLEVLSTFREPTQSEATWQYWKAIALRETGRTSESVSLLKNLQDDYGFYGMLAREMTGTSTRIPAHSPITLTEADQERLDNDQGIKRSYALVRANLRGEAVTEWSAAMRGRSDTELIRAALHARKAGFYDRMIAAADRTQREHDFTLRFPSPFKEAVLPAAQEKSLDPWWVLGLIRQESRFIPDIRSSVGASGLMQIMPATGKMIAKNIGMKNTGNLRLTDVTVNVQLGTAYMRQLKDRFGGSALLASAAYNAGPGRALSWRAALPQRIEGAAFAESIPFPETRDYVKRVLANAVLYHAIHNGGTVPSLRRLLGEVNPNDPLGDAS